MGGGARWTVSTYVLLALGGPTVGSNEPQGLLMARVGAESALTATPCLTLFQGEGAHA